MGNVSAGIYEAAARILYSGDVIAEKKQDFRISPQFEITGINLDSEYVAGNTGNIIVTIKNTGSAAGLGEVRLLSGDITDEDRRLWFNINEEKEIKFSFLIPDYLEDKNYTCTISVESDQMIVPVKEIFQIHVMGYKLAVDAALDKLLYDTGDVAKLTLKVNSENAFTPDIFAQITFDAFDITTDTFTVTASTKTLQFDLPVPAEDFASKKIFYGLYLHTGRALYLNTIYIHQKQKSLLHYKKNNYRHCL